MLSRPLPPGPGQGLETTEQGEQTGGTRHFITFLLPGKLKCIILSLRCSFSQNTRSRRDSLQPQRSTFKCFVLRRHFFPCFLLVFFFLSFLCLFSNLSESTDIPKLFCRCCCFPPDPFPFFNILADLERGPRGLQAQQGSLTNPAASLGQLPRSSEALKLPL